MRRLLLCVLVSLMTSSMLFAQTVLSDWDMTTIEFEKFNNGATGGGFVPTIANPDPTGINTSDSVGVWEKKADAGLFMGGFSNPNGAPVDGRFFAEVCVKVWTDGIDSLTLKLEELVGGGPNWEKTKAIPAKNQWVEICFDLSEVSDVSVDGAAAGRVYNKIVWFFDIRQAGNGTDSAFTYMDDIVAQGTPCNPIVDFETPSTTTNFQYFGSSLDGTLATNIPNPDKSGLNLSDTVLQYIAPGDAGAFAGAFTNPNPTNLVNASNGGEICVLVWSSQPNIPFALKLEDPTDGSSPNWVTVQTTSTTSQWEELCFSFDSLSVDPPNNAASAVYRRIVIFPSFGVVPATQPDTVYVDNLCAKVPPPDSVDVTFICDMNEFSGSFTTLYVSGTFNNFDNSAPMSDGNGDGIYEATVRTTTGNIEYKFQLDEFAQQEEFSITDECIVVDPSGQFINRGMSITETTTLDTVCYGSCYACGEEVELSFRLGFDAGATIDTNNVFLTGGGNFGSPTNESRFRLIYNETSGFWENTLKRERGFASYYTFANGVCPDFSCKEDISGQDCADPSNFNDRQFLAVAADTLIANCFGNCDATSCGALMSLQAVEEGVFTAVYNRFNEQLALDFGINNKEKEITILDIAGRIVYSNRLAPATPKLDVSMAGLSKGLYIITVQSGNKRQVQKILK